MNQSDIIILESLKPHMSDFVYAMVIQAVEKAGSIREVTDKSVMFELVKAKQSFGGNRSAAGAYAASVRWGKGGKDLTSNATSSTVSGGGQTPSGGDAVNDKYDPDIRMQPVISITEQVKMDSGIKSDIQTVTRSLHKLNDASKSTEYYRSRLDTDVTGLADTMIDVGIQRRAEHLSFASKAIQRIGLRATRAAQGAEMSTNPEWKAQSIVKANALRQIHGLLKDILADFKKGDLHKPKM
jgi:hypothetical protein